MLLLILCMKFSQIFASVEDERARKWLSVVNDDIEKLSAILTEARWNYETNITDENSKTYLDASDMYDAYERSLQSELIKFDTRIIQDTSIRRQIELLQKYAINTSIWNQEASKRERFLINSMTTLFNTKSICSWQSGQELCAQNWQFDPDILQIFANQRDYDSLIYAWRAWRDAVGPPIRAQFLETIDLLNLKARSMGFSDYGEVWRSNYETSNFDQEIAGLFYEILPLYEQLHAYVRRRMKDVYRGKFHGHTVPAHILGNVMAEEWSNIYRYTIPYPNKSNLEVTRKMRALGYDQKKLFELANDFYTSMGLIPAPELFWQKSIFARMPDRRMVCHATSWDMFKTNDTRIRMCAKISQFDLIIAHHEMGHIQYFLQYADQPAIFRQPPNPGFHESIGDTIALAASTKKHLITLGLLDVGSDQDTQINMLYKQALFKIPFLVFSYLVDFWRYRVFDGTYTDRNLNRSWWDLYFQLMGLTPPVQRNESDFDAASKSHIVNGMEFNRYFVSGIIQFQFYQAMCNASGHSQTMPLHECDFYANRTAGRRLAELLKSGASVHWTEAMRKLTGDTRMSARALLNYFQPLHDWLKSENSRNSVCYGWGQIWADQVTRTLNEPRC